MAPFSQKLTSAHCIKTSFLMAAQDNEDVFPIVMKHNPITELSTYILPHKKVYQRSRTQIGAEVGAASGFAVPSADDAVSSFVALTAGAAGRRYAGAAARAEGRRCFQKAGCALALLLGARSY